MPAGTAAFPRASAPHTMPRRALRSGAVLSTQATDAWVARSLRAVWHPCTQMKHHERLPLIPVARGKGPWLYDSDGRRYLDAISSWWVNLFGHANPDINAALKDQLDTLEHAMLAGCTHAPAVELAERLSALTAHTLGHAFFASDGASAVEIALKMSFHAWRNRGHADKREFVCVANGYHGETIGALGVTDVALFKDAYDPLIRHAHVVASPDARQALPGETAADVAGRALADVRRLFVERGTHIAALIVEPLVQCAAGMAMHDPSYVRGLRALCDEFGVHLIADEIAVGFGRTGTLFACEQAGITPDFLCLSKGLTGGFLPLSAVLTTARVYEAFYDEYAKLNAFLHSHSYTGNALACAAARATLGFFQGGPVIERNRQLAAHMAAATAPLREHPHVGEVRQTGMILAIEMVRDKAARTPYDFRERRGLAVYRHALAHGALLRPIGNVIYFMPPYVIEPGEIDFLARVAASGIEAATCG